ncbi:MAG TPA: methionine synthase, partial [Acidimicrobiia bacterium]|nr:methionine synthase [Acidimicrobiia bacterium]
MITSETRILTTHAGSLPRPPELAEMHGRRSRGEPVAAEELRAIIERATAASIAAQIDAGIDVG